MNYFTVIITFNPLIIYGAKQNQLFCYGEGNMRKFRIRNAESNMRNDSNPVGNLVFNEYRSRACKLTIQKIPKIQWRELNPSNLSSGHASVGEGKGEDGRKCRKGRQCGEEEK